MVLLVKGKLAEYIGKTAKTVYKPVETTVSKPSVVLTKMKPLATDTVEISRTHAPFLLSDNLIARTTPEQRKILERLKKVSNNMVPSSIMRKFIYKSGRTQSAQGRETCP